MLPSVVVFSKRLENVVRVLSEHLEAKGHLSEIFFNIHVNLISFLRLTNDLPMHG